MATPNRFFEDAARVAGGAIGTLSGVKRELDNLVRHQLDRLLAGMDFVTREEF
ncbi:MAG: accessory factor UbiK family protein, partial [Pseudomonadota bacterium]|nr:accessory factor UbiK family protein [Pseudomonadota bacterium]